MLTPLVENRFGLNGLGFSISYKKGEIYFRKNGWGTGFYSEMMAHRDNGHGVVVLTNSPKPDLVYELVRSVALAYDWSSYVPVHQKMEIEQSLVDKITGRYKSNNATDEVFQKDNLLLIKDILDVEAEELVKVSDSIFVKRNSSRLIQFKPNSINGTINLLYRNRNDGAITSTFVKVDNDKKEPVEFLLEGDFEKALNAYRVLIKQDSANPKVTEDYLNELGYRFFHEDRMKLSQNTFKVNIMLYPDSFKVYDSYAEACMKAGEIDLAIKNYSKSLELNPQNNRTKSMLKELQKSE